MAFFSSFKSCSWFAKEYIFDFFALYTNFSHSFPLVSKSLCTFSKLDFELLYIERVLQYVLYISFSFWKDSDIDLLIGSNIVVFIVSLVSLNAWEYVERHFMKFSIELFNVESPSSDKI